MNRRENILRSVRMVYGLYPGVPLENVRALMDAMTRYATFYA